MARTRTTLRRIDPWSVLKFGFVANLVLLGIELLAAALLWVFVQRLGLIATICDLASGVGFEECGIDGGALFDTLLLLGLLGVVIQTGIIVFMTFLANLIFDLTGGIVVTLEDGGPAGAHRAESRRGEGRLAKLRAGASKARTRNKAKAKTDDKTGPDPIAKPERTWPGDRLANQDTTSGPASGSDGASTDGESLFDRG